MSLKGPPSSGTSFFTLTGPRLEPRGWGAAQGELRRPFCCCFWANLGLVALLPPAGLGLRLHLSTQPGPTGGECAGAAAVPGAVTALLPARTPLSPERASPLWLPTGVPEQEAEFGYAEHF